MSKPARQSPEETKSLEEEIELLGLSRGDTERLREMASKARKRLGSSSFDSQGGPIRRRRPPPRAPIAGVPRNFSTGHMLALFTLFALMFSLLAYQEARQFWYVVWGLFIVAVVLGQMLLFHGREPRAASVVVGGCVAPVLWIGTLTVVGGRFLMRQSWLELPFFLAGNVIAAALVGVFLGYLVGTVCAGIFLVTGRNWDAGKPLEVQPIVAEIVPEDGRGGDDPWADE